MTNTDQRARAIEIVRRLDEEYSDLTTGLTFSTPLELLMATILSAQCTDERVNIVTPILFERYWTAQDYADSDRMELETIIHSCGFFRNKARNIQGAGQVLVEDFGGEVPRTMNELLRLPGVARKTANVVLSHAFGLHEGIAVDTHVQRLSKRLALADGNGPEKVEAQLMELLPRQQWGRVSDVLIWHGRRVCGARTPRCAMCSVSDLCPSAQISIE